MIVTVTLNPALDLTYGVDALVPHGTHRVATVAERPGGKGLNVARVLHALGEPVLATGLLGGDTGTRVASLLDTEGVPTSFAPITGETRRTVAVVDAADATGFWEPGPVISSDEWSRFVAHFSGLLPRASVVALCGSLPPGLPLDAYATLIRLATEAGVPSVLDTSGPPLHHGLRATPTIAKPNAAELTELLTARTPPPQAAPFALSSAAPSSNSDAGLLSPLSAPPFSLSAAASLGPSAAAPSSPSAAAPSSPSGTTPSSPSGTTPSSPSAAAPLSTSAATPLSPFAAALLRPSAATPLSHSTAGLLGQPAAGMFGLDDGMLSFVRELTAAAIVISRGPDGLLAVTPDAVHSCTPPAPLDGNPTGAGDACVAALARGLRDATDWPELLADAVALSAAAVVSPVAGSFDPEVYRHTLAFLSSHQMTSRSSTC
ncbi:1-phosphofructokinase family hexose kinase [Actinoplanes sp. NPDC000266]